MCCLPGREPPAGPARAAGVGLVRAVELRLDLLRDDDVDPADRVDQVFELGEVDDDDVVDRDVGVGRDRARGEARAADLEGGVDLRAAVAGDLDAQVARDREVVEPVVRRVGAQQRDRVGVPVAGPGGRERVVGAEQQDRGRLREQAALVGRQRACARSAAAACSPPRRRCGRRGSRSPTRRGRRRRSGRARSSARGPSESAAAGGRSSSARARGSCCGRHARPSPAAVISPGRPTVGTRPFWRPPR